jgi:hypothetical protein
VLQARRILPRGPIHRPDQLAVEYLGGYLALEYEDVLKRKGMVPGGITEAEIDRFLDYVFRVSNLVPFVLRQQPVLPDPTISVFWK